MSTSNSYSYTQTFTLTHAKYLASKLAADLKRIQRFYGAPSDSSISSYEEEIIQLLKNGYLKEVKYGYKREGKFIEPTLIYTAQHLTEVNSNDDDPGNIRPGANIDNATFSSFLMYSSLWFHLSKEEQNQFERNLPFKRIGANEPEMEGYLIKDRSYSNGGVAINRTSLKNI